MKISSNNYNQILETQGHNVTKPLLFSTTIIYSNIEGENLGTKELSNSDYKTNKQTKNHGEFEMLTWIEIVGPSIN